MVIHTHEFEIFPAMHLSEGRAIDFVEDEPTQSSVINQVDPFDTVQFWIDQGARWIHIINVDASFDRDASHNWPLIEKICGLPISVQYGGGIRTEKDIEWANNIGVDRILINAAAIETPELVGEAIINYGSERFGLTINTDPEGMLITRGWQAVGGLEAVTLGIQMRNLGINTAVHTRIHRDGTMSGADLEVSRQLAELTGLNIIVGGEVRNMNDVVECYNQPGISGILIGKALHSGEISLERALRETSQKIAFETGLPRWKQEQTLMKSEIRYRLSHRYLLENFKPAPGMRMLDAGGGNGIDSLKMAHLYLQVDLVERSRAMLQDFEQLAEEASPHTPVNTHNIDIREIGKRFEDNPFDLVLCHNVIQYSEDWESLLTTVIQPLKTGGYFSLITRNQYAEPYSVDLEDYEASQLPEILDKTAGLSGVFESDLIFFTPAFLVDWLVEHGFEITAIYGLICLTQHNSYRLPIDDHQADKLEILEFEMGKRNPYRNTARYIQVIARKSPG